MKYTVCTFTEKNIADLAFSIFNVCTSFGWLVMFLKKQKF